MKVGKVLSIKTSVQTGLFDLDSNGKIWSILSSAHSDSDLFSLPEVLFISS